MCFTVGNDFLPHIPGIEILEGGIDFMIDVYKNTCSSYGHLTKKSDKNL
jgi:5'-3' exonuclease